MMRREMEQRSFFPVSHSEKLQKDDGKMVENVQRRRGGNSTQKRRRGKREKKEEGGREKERDESFQPPPPSHNQAVEGERERGGGSGVILVTDPSVLSLSPLSHQMHRQSRDSSYFLISTEGTKD